MAQKSGVPCIVTLAIGSPLEFSVVCTMSCLPVSGLAVVAGRAAWATRLLEAL